MTIRSTMRIAMFAAATALAGCATIKHEHEVKPIHIVHDINIRVERELEEFFSFEEKLASSAPTTTQAIAH